MLEDVKRILVEMNECLQSSEMSSPYGDCESTDGYLQTQCLAECSAHYVIDKCHCKYAYMLGEKDLLKLFHMPSNIAITCIFTLL